MSVVFVRCEECYVTYLLLQAGYTPLDLLVAAKAPTRLAVHSDLATGFAHERLGFGRNRSFESHC